MKLSLFLTSLVLVTPVSAQMRRVRGKSRKKGSKSSKASSKMEFDSCVLANPALEQAQKAIELGETLECLCLSDDLEPQVEHASGVNLVFAQELQKWSDGMAGYEDTFEIGETVGQAHPFFGTLFNETQTTLLICSMGELLVTQMEKTCDYEFMKETYQEVSTALMDGFSSGVGHDLTLDECDEENTFSWSV